MKQEDYNSIMKLPWESKNTDVIKQKECPICHEKYCGNGIEKCLDCDGEKSSK